LSRQPPGHSCSEQTEVVQRCGPTSDDDSFYVMFFDPLLWIAVVIYGTCTLLWIIILRIVPLSVAYSVFSLSFLIVPTLAHLFPNEPVSWRVYAGGVLILSEILFIARAQ